MKKLGFIVGFLVVGMGLSAVGCAAEVDSSEPVTGDDQEVRAAQLVGAWTDVRPSSGPPPGALGLPIMNAPPGALGLPNMGGDTSTAPPPGAMGLPLLNPAAIIGIVFKSNGKFFADASSYGVIKRIAGTFVTRGSWLTLTPSDAALASDARFKNIEGAYRVRATNAQITVTKDGVALDLYKHDSYCAAAPDCDGQGLIVPACVGSFSCTATKACHFSCGVRR